MAGIADLNKLLVSISPELQKGDYVFCALKGELADYSSLQPIASFVESEGLSLILPVANADRAGLDYEGFFKQITLRVHSSLEAVGLTAAVAAKLTQYDISANVVAAYFHDHIFVPVDKAEKAMLALKELSQAAEELD